ncbi:hypothetical protein J2Z79_000070 [Symbiobacterium terraclitae]|uniref:Uncharacterized protein n=1 Tax=Symbiobacterium terraclitae TaxID=557451 RepID=A0ABS4JMC6_9FIRM|nr:hypothetical protein [Symbiobacterium terraclitae]MBP2016697.1 hypothetical protein [Symbiobacterium terraclitae]
MQTSIAPLPAATPQLPMASPVATYTDAAHAAWPRIAPMPGPAALGPDGVLGGRGTGVPGVALAPVPAVAPPAAPGGPHPLPGLPPCPLPWGFPNPFAISALVLVPLSAGPVPQPPGTVTATGPRGYLPGLGYFDLDGALAGAAPVTNLPGRA